MEPEQHVNEANDDSSVPAEGHQARTPGLGAATPRFGPPGPGGKGAVEYVLGNVWVRAVAYVFVAVLLLIILWNTRHAYSFALTVAVVGYLLAYVLNPLVDMMGRLRIGRGLAVGIVYIMLAVLVIVGSFLLAQVVGQLGEFLRLIPSALEGLTPLVTGIVEWLQGLPQLFERFGADPDAEFMEDGVAAVTPFVQTAQGMISDTLAQSAAALRSAFQRLLEGGGDYLVGGVASIVSGGVQVFFILLISAYFLFDFPRFSQATVRYVPVRYREVFLDVRAKTDRVVGGFLRGQVLISLLTGLVLWTGFTILGVPLALTLAFVAALFNIVPYLGPIISSVPAVLLGLTVSPWIAVATLAVILLANQLEAHVFAPMVLGKTTNLHPVTVIISILIGVALWGVLGALIAIPIVALAKVILEEYLLTTPAFASSSGPAAAEPAAKRQRRSFLRPRQRR